VRGSLFGDIWKSTSRVLEARHPVSGKATKRHGTKRGGGVGGQRPKGGLGGLTISTTCSSRMRLRGVCKVLRHISCAIRACIKRVPGNGNHVQQAPRLSATG